MHGAAALVKILHQNTTLTDLRVKERTNIALRRRLDLPRCVARAPMPPARVLSHSTLHSSMLRILALFVELAPSYPVTSVTFGDLFGDRMQLSKVGSWSGRAADPRINALTTLLCPQENIKSLFDVLGRTSHPIHLRLFENHLVSGALSGLFSPCQFVVTCVCVCACIVGRGSDHTGPPPQATEHAHRAHH